MLAVWHGHSACATLTISWDLQAAVAMESFSKGSVMSSRSCGRVGQAKARKTSTRCESLSPVLPALAAGAHLRPQLGLARVV